MKPYGIFFLQMKHEQTNVLHDVKSGRHRRCIFESLKTGYDKRYGFNIIVRWIFYLKKMADMSRGLLF